MSDELVFTVNTSIATPARAISLKKAGLYERAHLQEWVIAHPQILGPGVAIITAEFGAWSTDGRSSPAERDRLDVLGIDPDNRLVVAELKRGAAPSTTQMQAVNYAARVSRFTEQDLIDEYVRFWSQRQVSEEVARERITQRIEPGLDPELLLNPRIVLVASSFPRNVTASAVFLNERGLDITLVQVLAYRTESESESESETLITVSQLYPVRDVEDFTIAPGRHARSKSTHPVETWSGSELESLVAATDNPTVLALLDLTSNRPGEWVTRAEIKAASRAEDLEMNAGFARLTVLVRSEFGRNNWPVELERRGGAETNRYRMSPDLASSWAAARDDRTVTSD